MVVASNRQPPFLPHSVDLILNIFGFPHWAGFSTILPKRSHVLLVDPGPEHLIELRRIIYPTVRPAALVNLDAAEQAGFSLKAEHTVRYEMQLETPQMIQDLLLMTPHHVRIPHERRIGVAALEQLSVTVDVVLRLVGRSRQN
jgi:23S rRNA (guanine745-N1)-methyltransferase